jgi:hypothetical protein
LRGQVVIRREWQVRHRIDAAQGLAASLHRR